MNSQQSLPCAFRRYRESLPKPMFHCIGLLVRQRSSGDTLCCLESIHELRVKGTLFIDVGYSWTSIQFFCVSSVNMCYNIKTPTTCFPLKLTVNVYHTSNRGEPNRSGNWILSAEKPFDSLQLPINGRQQSTNTDI